MLVIYYSILDKFITLEIVPKIMSLSGEHLIAEVAAQWHQYTIFATLLNRLFTYIDRHYLQLKNQQSLGQHCQSKFKSGVFTTLH